MNDTNYLVELDLPPYFRYSPVAPSLMARSQLRQLQEELRNEPPDYLLISANDSLQDLQLAPIIDLNFVIDRRLPDFPLLRRRQR